MADRDAIVDILGAGIWVVDRHDRTQYVNARMGALLGHAPEAIEGRSFLQFIADEGQAAALAYLVQCRHGSGGQVDLPIRSVQGPPRWALFSATPANSSSEGSLVCLVVDITERKRVEQALRRSESHYRVLAELAPDHIFVIDRDDRVEYVNRAAAEQLRTTPDRLIGRRRSDIFPADVAERQGRSLQRVFTTEQPFYVEGHTVYLDREVWLGTWLAPVPDRNGEVKAVLGLSRDMTQRKRAEDALRATEQRLRVVLSNVPVVLWAADRGRVVTFCGGRALEALGGSPDDVLGRAFEDVRLEPFPALGDDVRRALEGESSSSTIDVRALTLEAWTVPLRDEHDEIAGATGVIVDITERRRLETELSNASKLEAIGRLAGGIAHDFNNNLTAILGYVDLMHEKLGGDTAVGRDLREVRHAAERAAGLVRRLLAFGRRQVLQYRSLDLRKVVGDLAPMLDRLIGERVRIQLVLAPDLLPVNGDAGEFEQVIMNLALNARDAMPAGGTLTIEAANVTVSDKDRRPTMTAGPHVLLTIRDTGSGMDARTKEHVFEPFFTTKPVGEGTGLGLSTVYGIVKQLHGFIWVESELGRGSAFYVYLPVAAEPIAEAASPQPAVRPGGLRQETILLVEDEPTVLQFAKRALELQGFRVVDAGSAEEALSLAGREPSIALLLTDVVMPQMSGPDLADRLRKARPDLAVLYMSGYPAGLVLQDSLDPSMRLISKPFTAAYLIATVFEILGRPT